MITPYSSAVEMMQALQNGQITAVDLLDLHLERIHKVNPHLNAIVTSNEAQARLTAVAADKAYAEGKEAPLLGLPLVLKDTLYTAGLPATGGLPARAEVIEEADSNIVGRLRAAGAVIMGKTNVPPYVSDWQSNNRVFGRSNNPWDLARTPGGSTGGGAAAVAAGLTPLEFGSDQGGSIRLPAAFCGIYGHKSSETAVPRSGTFPAAILPNPARGMAVQGPLARTAADLRLAFSVIAGPEVGEDVAWQLKLPPPRHDRLRDFRVAIMPTLEWLPVDEAILEAQDELALKLGQGGATVQQTQPEGFGDLQALYALFLKILNALVFIDTPEADRQKIAQSKRAVGSWDEVAMAEGVLASAADYIAWFGQREQVRHMLRRFFQEWDILLAPVTISLAFLHDARPYSQRSLLVNGIEVPYSRLGVYPGLCNLSGSPGTAFPVGLSNDGLPVGLQAIGPYLEDATTIRFAELVAEAYGGFQPPPE